MKQKKHQLLILKLKMKMKMKKQLKESKKKLRIYGMNYLKYQYTKQ